MQESSGDIIRRSIKEFEVASIHKTIMPLLLTFANEGFSGIIQIETRRGSIEDIIKENFYERIEDEAVAEKEYLDYINSFPECFRT